MHSNLVYVVNRQETLVQLNSEQVVNQSQSTFNQLQNSSNQLESAVVSQGVSML